MRALHMNTSNMAASARSDSESDTSLILSCHSSDFEGEEDSLNTCIDLERRVPDPYRFEPYQSDTSDSGDDGDNAHHPEAQEESRGRLDNFEWCLCGHCTIMTTAVECVCCMELDKVKQLIQGKDDCCCITEHPGFEPVCLNTYVLDTAYYQYRQQYGEDIPDTVERYRYTAYRQLARWAWGYLGKNVRVVLPACAVKVIREKYPDPDGHYTGFQ